MDPEEPFQDSGGGLGEEVKTVNDCGFTDAYSPLPDPLRQGEGAKKCSSPNGQRGGFVLAPSPLTGEGWG